MGKEGDVISRDVSRDVYVRNLCIKTLRSEFKDDTFLFTRQF